MPNPSPSSDAHDISADEVLGWTALFENLNYKIAADRFARCWEAAKCANLIEIGALYGWHLAKALYLQSLLGEPSARDKSLSVFEAAINRGGKSAWFNRMRVSLNRAKKLSALTNEVAKQDYAVDLMRAFDDLLENLGTTGDKFERWCKRITDNLQSDSHARYQEGLEQLGKALCYHATRSKYESAPDCRWRGVFGNASEVITFEAKIEHKASGQIDPVDVGQAHNQLTRAKEEYGKQGFTVRGTIVTHLTSISSTAEASAGSIKVLKKEAVLELWNRVRVLLSQYRDGWSLNDISARSAASQMICPKIPETGWLIRALDSDERFIPTERLLTEWS